MAQSASWKVRVNGMRKARAILTESLPAELRDAQNDEIEHTLRLIVWDAKRRAPRDTRPTADAVRLVDGITSKMSRKLISGRTYVAGGPGKPNHSHLVEYGTAVRATKQGANRGAMPAKPFMRPAVEWARPGHDRRMAQIGKRVERVLAGAGGLT